jgi:hypothetical protein
MDAFRFSPDLFEHRNEVLAELQDAGYCWLSHFSSVDTLHDVHGIEVCGIRDADDAREILRLLRRLFPRWRYTHLYHKDYGREPGWKAVVQRDPDREERWQSS